MTDSKLDLISRLKRAFRQNRLLSLLVGCPNPAPRWNRCVKRLLRELHGDARILDLGAGRHRRAPNVINLDIEPTPEIDLIGDGHSLPFKDNTFDAVISEAVLEHVHSPNRVVQEIHRVLKPGGYICVAVPFLQGYHASPHDYQRWTVLWDRPALRRLHRDRKWGMCRPDSVLTLDFPGIRWVAFLFRQSTPRESHLSACRMANVPVIALRWVVVFTQRCRHFSVGSLLFREKL